jgi:DNA-binding transcriptional LysR family regulator
MSTPATDPNFRTLDLNLLRVFDEVMAERSLTRAARNLALTQPAVSNALRRLRGALGDELVRRSGQGMEPTPRAMSLWPQVRAALRLLQESLAPQGFDPAKAENTFTLAMADASAAQLLPRLMAICAVEAPDLSLRLLPLLSRDPRKALDDEAIDIAVGHFPAVWADLSARAQVGKPVAYAHLRMYDGAYVCVMRHGHALASKPLTLERFCATRHVLVSFSGRPFDIIDEALATQGRQRRVALTVNQYFTAARVVATSDLLGVLPRHFVGIADGAKGLESRELPFALPPLQVDALWHSRFEHNSAHRWLRDAVARCSAPA